MLKSNQKVAKIISGTRRKLGMSREDLATAVGVSNDSIYHWEKADRDCRIRGSNAVKLEKALNLKPKTITKIYHNEDLNLYWPSAYAKIRTERGFSIQDVAKRIGVTQTTVYNWECGHTSPKGIMIVAMAKMFGVTPNDLLDFEV